MQFSILVDLLIGVFKVFQYLVPCKKLCKSRNCSKYTTAAHSVSRREATNTQVSKSAKRCTNYTFILNGSDTYPYGITAPSKAVFSLDITADIQSNNRYSWTVNVLCSCRPASYNSTSKNNDELTIQYYNPNFLSYTTISHSNTTANSVTCGKTYTKATQLMTHTVMFWTGELPAL